MNIFKKIFRRKKQEKQDECWYNNSHEKKKSRWSKPNGEPWSDNSVDTAVTMQIAKR